MRKKITLLLTIVLLSINSIESQDMLQNLNNLPTTIEVRAPEFNTEIKYFFKIDTSKNNLIIQDIRKSKEGKIHYYQWLYEIPINQLGPESFKASRDSDNEIKLTVETTKNANTIMFYMFQDKKVSSIMAVNGIQLGKWAYSDSLFNKINNAVKSISDCLTKTGSSSNESKQTSGKFKYIAKNVTSVNATMDDDLSIGNGYYFEQIINENNMNLCNKVVKRIKSNLKKQNIDYQNPLPVIIYTSKEGDIESIFIVNEPSNDYCIIDLKKT